ncbi:MAG TPA: CAP domain-containing protein, partial [Burkholderiales bacterium]|nr:CAP domain-containing protein [Burkholderiales bacterium]
MLEQSEQRVITLTNELRVKHALTSLSAETRLTQTARAYAAHLANTGKLDHEADGATPAERVKKRGYSYCMVAENLASEYSSAGFTADALARNVVEGWSESQTHRTNMLHPDLTHIG